MPAPLYSWLPLFFLWFGASISVAEIYTGGAVAGAGPVPGLTAIFLGHLFGSLLLGLMAYIGFRERKPAIMCTRNSFGEKGSWLLSVANILQLVGWTAVMLQQCGDAASLILNKLWGVENGFALVVICMGVLVFLRTAWERQGTFALNVGAVTLLAGLALLVSWVLWGMAADVTLVEKPATMPFAQALELSIVMPLSWVPLVADYSCRANKASVAVFAPSVGYFIGSVWMYTLGFAGSLYTGEMNPSAMLLAAGFGIAALSVVALSTIVTTFLDVYSAVASAQNITRKIPFRAGALCFVTIGTALALFWNYQVYENFLHYIGAIFAPLSAILIADHFLLRENHSSKAFSIAGLASLILGICAHTLATRYNAPLGPIMTCLLATLCIHCVVRVVSRMASGRAAVR